MSIRPIDSQGVLQRTGELQKTTTASREQQQQAQHHFMRELQQVSTREQHIVRQGDDTKKSELHQEQKQKRKRQLEPKTRKSKTDSTSSSLEDGARGLHLDIKA